MGDAHYPEIKQDYNHVDACTMWFVKQPEYYDVNRHREPVWRHHHRPGRHHSGRPGHRGRRQHQSPRACPCSSPWAQRAPNTPARTSSIRSPPSCAGGMMMDTLGEPAIAQSHRQGRARRPGVQADQEPGRRQDGHGHARSRGSDREDGELGRRLETGGPEPPSSARGLSCARTPAASTPASATSHSRKRQSSSPRRIGPRQEVAREFDEGRTVERARRDNSFVPELEWRGG